MKTSPPPEAYCAEMNCDWQGEVPAIARCPKCGSRQLRHAPVVYIEHPEFGTVPLVNGRVPADFIEEARAKGIDEEAIARLAAVTLRVPA